MIEWKVKILDAGESKEGETSFPRKRALGRLIEWFVLQDMVCKSGSRS